MTDIAELALRVDALEVKTANAELDRLSGTSKRVDRDVAIFSANSSRSLEFVKTGVAALVAGFAGLSLSRSIKESIELNQRYKELGIAMEVVGRNVGVNSQQLNTTTAALEKMGISMIEARQTVTRLAASHIDLANAEKLADLARNAAIVGQINTSEALDRIVHGIRSAEVEVLKTIGITVQFDQAYKQLAAQLGKTTQELTQQEKQQARVNVVLGEAPALVGLYEAAMNNAGKQFRSTERLAENLKIKIGELFDETTKLAVRSYTNLLKELDNTFTDLTDSGELQSWGDQLAYTFAFLGDAARVAVSPVIILLRTVDAAIERAKALASGDFTKSRQIGADFDEFLKGELKVITGSTALRDELRKQRVERDLLTSAVGRGATAVQKETEEIIESVKVGKQARDERKEFVSALAKQAAEAGKSRIEIQRMEAALLGVSDAAEPYLRIIENQARAEEDLRVSRQRQADDLRKIESITQSVRTKQEIYNDTVKELDDLLTKGLGINAYNRALEKARDELTKTETKTREFWDTNEQIWIQGVRNVQTSLANGLFNVFDDGLKGMVNGVKRAVGQMLAEFASIKILQSTGIAGLLGLGSTAAVASGGAASGGGLSALNLASLGSGALNLVQGGFGLTGAIGGGLQSLGGAIGSNSLFQFGAGVGGDLLGAGIGTAGSLGAGLGALAGPAAIAGIADIGLRQLFGDKKLGGTAGDILSYVPVVGTLINGLFGRGAPKFQNEALVGNVSAGGFEGVLNQAFRESGSVFRGSRTSNFIADTDTGNLLNQFGRLSESGNIPGALRDSATDPAVKRALEVGKFLDEAFGSIGDTLKQTADKLGLSADALNNFNIELDLVSEKGETLSKAQISAEITRISDAMIDTLIPNLDELAKKGETSADTLNRLNAQFSVLESAAMLFGNTAEQAAEKVRALGIDGQTAFIESLGGVQVAAVEIQEFYDTVFTDSQKLEVTKNRILDVLKPLGVDFVPTLDQLYEAVKSGNPELIRYAFLIDGLVVDYNRLSDAIGLSSTQIDDSGKTTEDAAKKESELAKAREAAIRVSEKASRAEIQRVEAEKFAAELDAINALKKEAESLRDTFLRSGDAAGAIMNELAIISENIQFTSAGAFNAALAKQIADASQAVANRASENALRVPDVAGFINSALGNIVSDSIVTPIYIGIRDAIVDGSGDMSNAVRDSVDGFAKVIAREQARISRAPRGQGIAGVLSAQSDLSFFSAAGFAGGKKQFGRDVLAYGEAMRRLDDRLSDGQITLTEYDGAVAGLNDVMGGAAKLFGDVESQFERIKNSGLALASSGINAIGFYFNDITKQVAELNKQAAESGSAIAQTTDAIGRLKSASFVFGQSVGAVFSGNAAAGIDFDGSPETDKAALIGQAAGIAAQVLTTADAARFAQQLAGEEAFNGIGSTGLRDISLLIDGLKAFDPASFENAFLRINDALITGAVTQEQYNVLFNTALDEFEGLGTSAGGAKSALGQLREAARNLADELLLGDKSILSVFQKTSEAQRQYNEVIERARSGNATSGELSGGVNNLLDAQLNSASTKFEFDKQFATVINDLQSIGQTTEDRRLAEQKKSTEELKAEVKKLREDLNAANVAIAKSTAKTADVLDRWSIVGLPATEA
jgi:hypothetical protein